MSQTSDPLEERDILKILDALDEPRVQEKLGKVIIEFCRKVLGLKEGQTIDEVLRELLKGKLKEITDADKAS